MLRQAAPKRLSLGLASQGGLVEPWLKPLQRGGVIGFIPGLKARVALAEARGGLDPVLGRLGPLEVRLATTAEGHPAGAAAALQGLLRGDGGGAERRLAVLAARPRRVRRALRPPARARPRGDAEAVPQAEAAGRRHLSPAAPGGGGPALRLLLGRRIRRRAARRRPIRTCASSSSAAPACCRPIATSARWSCSGTASGPMSSTTAST